MARVARKRRDIAPPVPPRELTEFPADVNAEVPDYDAARVWLDWLGARDKWATDNGYDPDDWIL